VKADVVVIGAGALGLSTALHCALANRSVVLVERGAAGSQASGRAAGLFKSVQADELRTRLARRSIEKVVRFGEWSGVDLDVRRSGSVLLARTDRHKAYLRAERDHSLGWGVAVSDLSTGAVPDRLSYYRPVGDDEAVWCPEDVYVEEPMSLVAAYVAACSRHGAQLFEEEEVVAVLVSGGAVTGVETSRRTIEAAMVVDAAGAWSRRIGELAGAHVPLAPVRHQLFITEPSGLVQVDDPIARVFDAALYLRPARGGLMVGAFEADPLPVDPREEKPSFTTDDVPLDLAVLRERAAQVAEEAPLAAEPGVSEHRGGMFTMTPDGLFLLGPVPDVRGLWIASGCNGLGFSFSPALGEMLAGWMDTGHPPAGADRFSPERLGPATDDVFVRSGIWQYAHYYDPGDA
jgi:glycine/D-amino acid oxidase-like deaminating enzyme